jgi:streptogramin lyase
MGGGAATGDGWIGRITTAGVLTKFPLPRRNVQANFIAAGADGALWFGTSDATGNSAIGRITTAGVVTEFALPTPSAVVLGITAGPDGALWFAEPTINKIGRITTAGVITEFTVPTAGSGPTWIVTGPDSALWFTEGAPVPTANNNLAFTGNRIGRITTSGAFSEFTLPTAGSGPVVIAAGPDGALWFTEATANKIGRLTLPVATPAAPTASTPLPPPPAAQTVYTVPSGQLPAAAVVVNATGTYGSASVSVTLDVVKALQASFAATSTYNVYVLALVPGAVLGSPSPVFLAKARAPGSWGLLQFPIPAFLENVAQSATSQVVIEILTNTNVSSLVGTEFYVGYGTSDTEMLTTGRYRGVYKVQ